MKTRQILILAACGAVLASCAATVPKELANAREAYRRASTGDTAQIAPAEVHVAGQALEVAEAAFEDDPDSYQTRDLAYVAERKAQMAEATASIILEKQNQARAKDEYRTTQGEIVKKTKHELERTSDALEASQRESLSTAKRTAAEREARDANDRRQASASADRLSSERAARQTAEQNAAEARLAREAAEQRVAEAHAALAELAAIKDERRGMVITLSGSVLFASNRATLLPAARVQLGKVVDVLLKDGDRQLTIEGHTDSQGSDAYNLDLSQRRAEAVRTFLERRGYQAKLIAARGMGEGSPIADNASPEGRANNRRVEIVIDRTRTSSR